MPQKPNIVIWGKQNCPHCERVRAFLQDRRLEYKTVDVEGNDSYRDVLEVKYNVRRVPVVEIGGDTKYEAVIGADLERLAELLGAAEQEAGEA